MLVVEDLWYFIYHTQNKKFIKENKNINIVPFNFTNEGSQLIFKEKMNKNFSHPLMDDNILPKDLKEVKNFLNKKNIILTQSKYVKKFENEWSKWLGVKYSVFVNSGSSANILSLAVMKILSKKKRGYSSIINMGIRY